jgi:hypothetical protein
MVWMPPEGVCSVAAKTVSMVMRAIDVTVGKDKHLRGLLAASPLSESSPAISLYAHLFK